MVRHPGTSWTFGHSAAERDVISWKPRQTANRGKPASIARGISGSVVASRCDRNVPDRSPARRTAMARHSTGCRSKDAVETL
jgi:hypothetical protein